MAYITHEWMNKELITAEKLNHLEIGIKEASENTIEGLDLTAETVTAEDTQGLVGVSGETSSIQAILDALAQKTLATEVAEDNEIAEMLTEVFG